LCGAWQKPKKNPPGCVGGQLVLRLVESLSEGGKIMESDLDNRSRLRNAKVSRKYGSTLVRTLRERYGENFAAGLADTATLREVINRLDAASLNRLQADLDKGASLHGNKKKPARGVTPASR
jgi:hypothetical protein